MQQLIADLAQLAERLVNEAARLHEIDTRGIGSKTARAIAVTRTHLDTAAMWAARAHHFAGLVAEAIGQDGG